MPSFHFLKYHIFTNNRSGCHVFQDAANSSYEPRNLETNTRIMNQRVKCAQIQLPNQSNLGEDNDCVCTIGGVLTTTWHGTWHRRVDPVLTGSYGLYAEFSYNDIDRELRKSVTLWPLTMYQLSHVLFHHLDLNLMGSDHRRRQCTVGLGYHMYDASKYDIVRIARTVILPRFLQHIATVPSSIVSELAQDPLAHDNTRIQQALALEVVLVLNEADNGSLSE